MIITQFQTTTRKEQVKVPIGSFYFYDNEVLGPIEIKLPLVLSSRLIPDDQISTLEEILFGEIEQNGIDVDANQYKYGDLHTIMHFITHDYQPSLLDIIRNKRELHPYFDEDEDSKLSPTEWLRMNFDWSRMVDLPEEFIEALYLQKEAHVTLRKIFHSYLLDFQLDLIQEQSRFREAIKESIQNGIQINPEPYHATITEKKRDYSSALRELRKKSSSLSPEILSNLEKLEVIQKETRDVLEEYDPVVEVDLRKLSMQVYPRKFQVFDFDFGRQISGGGFLTYDIETRSWHGSMTNPTGINAEVCFGAVSSEYCRGGKEFFNIGNAVVGIFDIGDRKLFSEKLGREFDYIKARNPDHLRLLTSDLIYSLSPFLAGGHNHDSYDLSRSMNPNRDPAVKAEVLAAIKHIPRSKKKRITDQFTQGDSMFMVNPDNSQPWYIGTTYMELFGFSSASLDSLHISRNYLSSLTLDHKLESVSEMLMFFSDFEFEYEKIYDGYNDVEVSMHRANNNPEQAYKGALYAAEDAATQLQVMYSLSESMAFIHKILHIDQNTLHTSSKSSLAGLIWDKYFFHNFGITRNVHEKNEISSFDVKSSKIKSLETAFSRAEKNLEIEKGAFENVDVFFTPYFSESAYQIIQNNEIIHNLYDRLVEPKIDIIEDIIIQQIMDELIVQYLVDAVKARSSYPKADQFRIFYGMGHEEFLERFRQRMDGLADLFEPEDLVNYTGDLLFVRDNPYLVEILKDNNFHHLGSGGLISIGKGRVVYGIRKNGKVSVASSGFQMSSPKKRFTTDNVFQGREPNFYDNLLYDVVATYMANGSDLGEVTRLLTTGLPQRPIEDFFMTVTCGEDTEDYSADYRRSLDFMLKKSLGMKKDQREVIIVEGEDNLITPTIVDTGNRNSWKGLNPHLGYYKKRAFKKSRNLYKLCNVLGVAQYLE